MGSVFLRGDSWVGEYRVNGKPKRKTFGKKGVITKTLAKEMLKKIEQKVKLGQYDMLDARIPINSVLRKLLLEQRLKAGGSEYVFLSSNGNPYKRHDSLKQAFNGALRRANITGLRFHDLRHTAATRMIESGASIVAVSRILGHADLKTTMRYAHPENSLKEAVENLGNFTLNYSQNCSQEILEKNQVDVTS